MKILQPKHTHAVTLEPAISMMSSVMHLTHDPPYTVLRISLVMYTIPGPSFVFLLCWAKVMETKEETLYSIL